MKKSTQDTQREIEKKRIGGRKASAIPGRRCKPFHYTKRWFRDPPAREHGTLIIREEDIILRESGIIIRQTECRREWPLEKTLETRLYPIHPFPARPCTHAHARIHGASCYDRFARNYTIRLLARGETLPRDSKRFQEDSVLKRSANLERLSTARKQGGNLILQVSGHAILILSFSFFIWLFIGREKSNDRIIILKLIFNGEYISKNF